MRNRIQRTIILTVSLFLSLPGLSHAWYDKTHLAIAKAAGYPQWYNAAGPDIAKIKAGEKEARNHYSNNPAGSVITPQMILDQVLGGSGKSPILTTARMLGYGGPCWQ